MSEVYCHDPTPWAATGALLRHPKQTHNPIIVFKLNQTQHMLSELKIYNRRHTNTYRTLILSSRPFRLVKSKSERWRNIRRPNAHTHIRKGAEYTSPKCTHTRTNSGAVLAIVAYGPLKNAKQTHIQTHRTHDPQM